MYVYISLFICEGESCTYWHGLAAVEGADCRLSLSMCGKLDKGTTWRREQMHSTHTQTLRPRHTHSLCTYSVNAINQVSLKADGILMKDVELYLIPQKSVCRERLSLHSGPPHSGH